MSTSEYVEKPLTARREPLFPTQIYQLCPVSSRVSEHNDRHILLDTIHDGYVIPAELEDEYTTNSDFRRDFAESFEVERDWGAGLIAKALAEELGLGGFRQVLIARNVLDFGRFPGISRPWSAHLDRLAVSGPLAPVIRALCQEEILGDYAKIAAQLEDALKEKLGEPRASAERPVVDPDKLRESRLLKIAIHTFDEFDPQGLRRPEVGLIHRSKSVAERGHLPEGVFSRLYPDQLAAFSADRLLKAAITCMLEKNYVPEISDHPYMLPEGTVEMRSQAWLWFRYLRGCFERDESDLVDRLKERCGVETYDEFWSAVLNPNAIHPATRIVGAFLEGKIERPRWREVNLQGVRLIDRAVNRYLEEKCVVREGERSLVEKYQYDAYRPSCLVIEVRKDAIFRGHWSRDSLGRRVFVRDEARDKRVRKIARSIGEGIAMYWRLQEEKKRESRD